MTTLSAVDLPHDPGSDPDFQESWVLIFRDYDTNACGFLRSGSYVNRGTTETHWGMSLGDGTRFRRHLLGRAIEAGDRQRDKVSSGSMTVSFPGLEHIRFQGEDVDASADLRMWDFFPSQERDHIGGERHGQPVVTDGSHGHPESAGRVEGIIRIGEKIVQISNGIGYRDHAFGPRPDRPFTQSRYSSRWNAGSVGPELSWSLHSQQSCDGVFSKMGWMIRDGKREKVRDFHNVASILGDGFSVLGGWTVVELEGGERLRLDYETIAPIVTSTHLPNGGPGSSPAGQEAISIVRWEGREGVADFMTIDNAHRGELPVENSLFAVDVDGISRARFDPSWLR